MKWEPLAPREENEMKNNYDPRFAPPLTFAKLAMLPVCAGAALIFIIATVAFVVFDIARDAVSGREKIPYGMPTAERGGDPRDGEYVSSPRAKERGM